MPCHDFEDEADLDEREYPDEDEAEDDEGETVPCRYCRAPVYEDAELLPRVRELPVAGGRPAEPATGLVRDRVFALRGGFARLGVLAMSTVAHDETGEARGSAPATMRVALVYDLDACRTPTGVTRHALAQLERLGSRPGVDLTVVSGRMSEPDGLAYWESIDHLTRRELPVRTRNALRWWRVKPWPPLEWWTGPVDWVYCPAEYFVPTRQARRAVTSHDVLQNLGQGPVDVERLGRTFGRADLILSVSRFNTERLLEAFPSCEGRVAQVPNGAEDLFFEPATERQRGRPRRPWPAARGAVSPVRGELSATQEPTQARPRREPVARGRRGDLALVLLGTGSDSETERSARRSPTPAAVPWSASPGIGRGRPSWRSTPRQRPWCSPRSARASASRPSRRWAGGSRRPGELDRPARDRRGSRLGLRPGRRRGHSLDPARPPRSPRRVRPAG